MSRAGRAAPRGAAPSEQPLGLRSAPDAARDAGEPEQAPIPNWDSRARAALRRRLLAWFRRSARDLPWRRTRDVYQVWVSEIMLQQTQVATVVPYFERFIARFPTIAALAEADEGEVLRCWEGLGYYRRARQLHAAAQRIVAEHDGQFPAAFEDVLRLPGIGRYTAGAILSIARDERWPILEANTIRLFSRLLLYEGDPRDAAAQRTFWEFAAAILPREQAGLFNQSLMELGSEVCRPREPLCLICPVQPLCPTSARGWQARIPAAARKENFEDVTEAAVVVWACGEPRRVLLRRCGPGERWAGLWDFPRFAVPDAASVLTELPQRVAASTGVAIEPPRALAVLKHGVTRYRITLHCVTSHARSEALDPKSEARWVPLEELDAYALSSTGRRISELVSSPASLSFNPQPIGEDGPAS